MYWLGFPISKVSLYWEPFLFTYVLICDEFVKRRIHQKKSCFDSTKYRWHNIYNVMKKTRESVSIQSKKYLLSF
jgi:hypothetical protein